MQLSIFYNKVQLSYKLMYSALGVVEREEAQDVSHQ